MEDQKQELDGTIDRETAERELERFVECMALTLDSEGLDENDRKDITRDKESFIEAVMAGKVVLDEEGQPTFTTSEAKQITFYEPRGSAMLAMDRKKPTADVGKMYAMLADLTKTSVATFSGMRSRDLKVCMSILLLFLT